MLAKQGACPKPAQMDRWAHRDGPRPVHGNETRHQGPETEGEKTSTSRRAHLTGECLSWIGWAPPTNGLQRSTVQIVSVRKMRSHRPTVVTASVPKIGVPSLGCTSGATAERSAAVLVRCRRTYELLRSRRFRNRRHRPGVEGALTKHERKSGRPILHDRGSTAAPAVVPLATHPTRISASLAVAPLRQSTRRVGTAGTPSLGHAARSTLCARPCQRQVGAECLGLRLTSQRQHHAKSGGGEVGERVATSDKIRRAQGA